LLGLLFLPRIVLDLADRSFERQSFNCRAPSDISRSWQLGVSAISARSYNANGVRVLFGSLNRTRNH
jgi:hypothetical protein